MLGGFLDIALRDVGLLVAALALWRLSQHFDAPAPARENPAAARPNPRA